MEQHLRIGIDCDGVLRNFVKSVKRVVEIYHPEFKDVLEDEPKEYSFESWLWFWEPDDAEQFIFKKHHWEIFAGAEPHAKAVKDWPLIVNWAEKNSHKLVLVSSQHHNTTAPTSAWIGKHHFDFKEIHYTSKKWRSKVDILIDDSLSKLVAYADNCDGLAIRFNRQWNAHDKTFTSINRLSDLIKL